MRGMAGGRGGGGVSWEEEEEGGGGRINKDSSGPRRRYNGLNKNRLSEARVGGKERVDRWICNPLERDAPRARIGLTSHFTSFD
jgi:hypothetical protein